MVKKGGSKDFPTSKNLVKTQPSTKDLVKTQPSTTSKSKSAVSKSTVSKSTVSKSTVSKSAVSKSAVSKCDLSTQTVSTSSSRKEIFKPDDKLYILIVLTSFRFTLDEIFYMFQIYNKKEVVENIVINEYIDIILNNIFNANGFKFVKTSQSGGVPGENRFSVYSIYSRVKTLFTLCFCINIRKVGQMPTNDGIVNPNIRIRQGQRDVSNIVNIIKHNYNFTERVDDENACIQEILTRVVINNAFINGNGGEMIFDTIIRILIDEGKIVAKNPAVHDNQVVVNIINRDIRLFRQRFLAYYHATFNKIRSLISGNRLITLMQIIDVDNGVQYIAKKNLIIRQLKDNITILKNTGRITTNLFPLINKYIILTLIDTAYIINRFNNVYGPRLESVGELLVPIEQELINTQFPNYNMNIRKGYICEILDKPNININQLFFNNILKEILLAKERENIQPVIPLDLQLHDRRHRVLLDIDPRRRDDRLLDILPENIVEARRIVNERRQQRQQRQAQGQADRQPFENLNLEDEIEAEIRRVGRNRRAADALAWARIHRPNDLRLIHNLEIHAMDDPMDPMDPMDLLRQAFNIHRQPNMPQDRGFEDVDVPQGHIQQLEQLHYYNRKNTQLINDEDIAFFIEKDVIDYVTYNRLQINLRDKTIKFMGIELDKCTICFNDITEEDVKNSKICYLKCNHMYHTKCICKSFIIRSTNPTIRFDGKCRCPSCNNTTNEIVEYRNFLINREQNLVDIFNNPQEKRKYEDRQRQEIDEENAREAAQAAQEAQEAQEAQVIIQEPVPARQVPEIQLGDIALRRRGPAEARQVVVPEIQPEIQPAVPEIRPQVNREIATVVINSVTARRIGKEISMLHKYLKDPGCVIKGFYVNEENMLEMVFLLIGQTGTPYNGGEYLLKILLSPEHPHKPPSFHMLTENNRFAIDVNICLSFSNFHPNTWSSSNTLVTMIVGFISFMNSNEDTAGAIIRSDEDRIKAAKASKAYNLSKYKHILDNLIPKYYR